MINRFYSVYLDLVLVDRDGRAVASSRGGEFPAVAGNDYRTASWFKKAIATASGDDYVVDDVATDPAHKHRPVALYAAAVRAGGEVDGEVVGALGVFFDWGEQSRVIVRDEPTFTAEEWKRTRVLLLDANQRVIAASDDRDLYRPYAFDAKGQNKGTVVTNDGRIIAFARTIGYEAYDGLGWIGVVEQRRLSDDELREKMDAALKSSASASARVTH